MVRKLRGLVNRNWRSQIATLNVKWSQIVTGDCSIATMRYAYIEIVLSIKEASHGNMPSLRWAATNPSRGKHWAFLADGTRWPGFFWPNQNHICLLGRLFGLRLCGSHWLSAGRSYSWAAGLQLSFCGKMFMHREAEAGKTPPGIAVWRSWAKVSIRNGKAVKVFPLFLSA